VAEVDDAADLGSHLIRRGSAEDVDVHAAENPDAVAIECLEFRDRHDRVLERMLGVDPDIVDQVVHDRL